METQNTMEKIKHNLDVATPEFIYFIKNMNTELSQWIQYRGVEIENENRIIFKFKSSQKNLSFTIYAGVNTGNIYYLLSGKTNEIYNYFRALKYEILELNH